MSRTTQRHRVVIIGGGFGGLYAAKRLGNKPVDVILIDRRNFHLFQPLLYQVATSGLSAGDICSPLRGILSRYKNTSVLLGEVTDIDRSDRTVYIGDTTVEYDSLIVAAGSGNSYFGNEHWSAHAPGLKSVEDAHEIRRKVLFAFEAAECETDPERRREWLTFVVVGGGPTGVELAGTIGEMANKTMKDDFRNIRPGDATIMLVDPNDRPLTSFDTRLSAKTARYLEELGVTLELGYLVTNVDERSVELSQDGRTRTVPSRAVLWAAGVATSPLSGMVARGIEEHLDRARRIVVEPDCSLPGHPEIMVIGDMANYSHQTGEPLPGLAPVAMQQGRYCAQRILDRLNGKSAKPFRYRDKGTMATVGRHRAVGVFGPLKLSGFAAWFTWLFVHLMYVVEFDNRLVVLVQWAWNYVTWNRGARLITPKTLPEDFQRSGRAAATESEHHPAKTKK